MSRDWTPRELYEVEQYHIKEGVGSLWDFMKGATFTINGETFPMVSEESIAQRQQFPLLGRLFEEYDKLYSFLVQVNGGLELLKRHEEELDAYIKTGQGDTDSPLIQWFEGKLDPGFYYRETNDALFLAAVQDEVGSLYRFEPAQGNCFWFPLTRNECISVWYSPDLTDGAQLRMKLEQRREDGSMGPHCEVLIDESFYTDDLSRDAICKTLHEIYHCIGHVRALERDAPDGRMAEIAPVARERGMEELADQIMAVFALKKQDLEEQILAAQSRASEQSGAVAKERKQGERG